VNGTKMGLCADCRKRKEVSMAIIGGCVVELCAKCQRKHGIREGGDGKEEPVQHDEDERAGQTG
jgi:hypothetical protein